MQLNTDKMQEEDIMQAWCALKYIREKETAKMPSF